MNVPLLDLKPQLAPMREELVDAITSTLDSTGYILGPTVEKFEKEVAAYCSTSFGVGVSSGTDALLVSLMSLNIGPGDKVVTTPYTFFATMGVILRVGAEPVFVDVEPDSLNIDAEQLAEIIDKDCKGERKIKAIIPVHLYGQCADMGKIMALSDKYSIPVIEDAAQAIGAEYPFRNEDGKVTWCKAGSMGIAGCFSFFPSKNLGCIGDGGLVTTSDEPFAAILRSNRNHGAEPKYFHSRIGGNFRLAAIQAAVLSVKLRYLDTWHKGRVKNAGIYRELFQAAGLIDNPVRLPATVYADMQDAEEHNHHIYNQFVIHVPERDKLREYLNKQSIGCEVYYPLCLHQQECVEQLAIFNQSFPVAEEAARTTLALPVFPELTPEQLEYVVQKIRDFYTH
ncbi:DegT/DnrJ/EryC1/StrS family aminotransferase [Desulfogranum japonicum]|uniref:DegT/DnrJ/EryC1/StrS family aminotransferase n=1 Tax=Desulfogranum japonicum TaxID=231447 RepID=UPI000400A07A|nr:DegT/DnrJ/EryC1/StrS family aminotransferase [Desulfogranum japonicum]